MNGWLGDVLGQLWKRFADWAWPPRDDDDDTNKDGEPGS